MWLLKQMVLKSLGSLGGILLGCLAATPALAELSLAQINSIARQTTVMIAPGLTPELVEELENNRNNPLARKNNPDGVWNPGSGVIIAREGKTYYVLTVTHNFKQRHLKQNLDYGIRTWDGKVHQVQQVNDGRSCPLEESISREIPLTRFGCYSIQVPGRVAGPDLAFISFESKQEYPVASLGNVENVNIEDRVYISGWPDPEKERHPETGLCRGRVARRERRLAWGPITRMIEPANGENGYSIFYVDLTSPGMSGGPVFDSNGFVIGVHGRGSVNQGKLAMASPYCSVSQEENNLGLESEDIQKAVTEAERYAPSELHMQFSSGQNGNNFVTLGTQVGINLPFNRQEPSPEFIQTALTSIQTSTLRSGRIEVAANRDKDITGKIDDPEDVVDDIYDLFTFKLENQLRDQPSAGCGSILLGDERERCRVDR